LSGPLLLFAMFHFASGPLGQWPFAGEIGWLCVIGIWSVILSAMIHRLFRTEPAPPTCDRPALGVLLELARTWAKPRSDRVETILVAVGGQEYDRAGDRALAQIMESEWSRKPTLIFALAAPGIGQELTLISTVDLVREAAESLWVPHRFEAMFRFSPRRGIPEKVYPLLSGSGEQVVLIAGKWNDESSPDLDPQTLSRTAQLVEEVALRWGKQHREVTRHENDDRSPSRSLQNPG
jgi:hypothetical protein